MSSLRLLVIDDHALFRAGLRMALASGMPGIAIIEASAIADALRLEDSDWTAILLDIKLPGLNGLAGIDLLRQRWPKAHILVLSSMDEPEVVREALAQGAAEFISKAQSVDEIIGAIGRVVSGNRPAPHTFETRGSQVGLTPRQREVLDLLVRGLPNKVIARRLTLSENTVRTHVQAILVHFDARSRSEAVFEARRQGLVS